MADDHTSPAEHPGQDDTGYRPSVNQVRDEPIPASHEEDPRQEAVVRNEQYPGSRSATRPDGEAGPRPGRPAEAETSDPQP